MGGVRGFPSYYHINAYFLAPGSKYKAKRELFSTNSVIVAAGA